MVALMQGAGPSWKADFPSHFGCVFSLPLSDGSNSRFRGNCCDYFVLYFVLRLQSGNMVHAAKIGPSWRG